MRKPPIVLEDGLRRERVAYFDAPAILDYAPALEFGERAGRITGSSKPTGPRRCG